MAPVWRDEAHVVYIEGAHHWLRIGQQCYERYSSGVRSHAATNLGRLVHGWSSIGPSEASSAFAQKGFTVLTSGSDLLCAKWLIFTLRATPSVMPFVLEKRHMRTIGSSHDRRSEERR